MIDDDYDDGDSFGVGEFGIGGRQRTPHGWQFFRCHDRGCWRRWRRCRPFCSDAVAAAFVVVVFVVARPLSSGRVSSLTLSLVTTVDLLMLDILLEACQSSRTDNPREPLTRCCSNLILEAVEKLFPSTTLGNDHSAGIGRWRSCALFSFSRSRSGGEGIKLLAMLIR